MGDADGALVRAFAWLEPYASGARSHKEFVNTTVEFDRVRANAGVPGFEGRFSPGKARTAMALAARLDPQFVSTARIMRTEAWQDAWLELLLPMR